MFYIIWRAVLNKCIMCKYKLRNNINELDKESEDKFHAFMLSFLTADGKQLV